MTPSRGPRLGARARCRHRRSRLAGVRLRLEPWATGRPRWVCMRAEAEEAGLGDGQGRGGTLQVHSLGSRPADGRSAAGWAWPNRSGVPSAGLRSSPGAAGAPGAAAPATCGEAIDLPEYDTYGSAPRNMFAIANHAGADCVPAGEIHLRWKDEGEAAPSVNNGHQLGNPPSRLIHITLPTRAGPTVTRSVHIAFDALPSRTHPHRQRHPAASNALRLAVGAPSCGL